MTSTQTVTGMNHVFVNTKAPPPNNVVQVNEGEELPSNLADGEVERLEQLGVFGQHPRALREKALAHFQGRADELPITDDDVRAMVEALDNASPPGPPTELPPPGPVIEVPDGTVDDVLDWVGDDSERAQAALDVEHRSDKPRSTLVDDLESILDRT